ncbi:MAG: hypothetical protein PQ964_01180 [Methanobacteriaceae archaeon]|jgi:type I restriction enzyme R subunit
MTGFNEKMLEDYFIKKFEEDGWKFVQAQDLDRETLEEPLLIKNFTRILRCINHDLDDDEIRQVLNKLKLQGSGIEGQKKILHALKYGVTVTTVITI